MLLFPKCLCYIYNVQIFPLLYITICRCSNSINMEHNKYDLLCQQKSAMWRTSMLVYIPNRPFYSCGLGVLAFEWTWGWGWSCFYTNLFPFSNKWKFCLKNTTCSYHNNMICIVKQERLLGSISGSLPTDCNCKMGYWVGFQSQRDCRIEWTCKEKQTNQETKETKIWTSWGLRVYLLKSNIVMFRIFTSGLLLRLLSITITKIDNNR